MRASTADVCNGYETQASEAKQTLSGPLRKSETPLVYTGQLYHRPFTATAPNLSTEFKVQFPLGAGVDDLCANAKFGSWSLYSH